MSVGNRPPTTAEQRAEPRRRIGELERRLLRGSAVPALPPGQSTPPFSFPGVVAAGSTTPLWYCTRDTITYAAVRISARLTGGGCAVDWHVDGSTLLSIVLNAGDQTDVYAAAFSIVDGQYFDFLVTAVGGEIDLSIQPIEAAV